MILAAGLGTRLRPYTEHTPKALFPVAGTPLIDRIIDGLAGGGCTGIIVNTHHLADRIEAHLTTRHYPVPVCFRREAHILGTGGGVKNAADFFDKRPFWIVNADIDTDIDYAELYRFHLSHRHPATLALVDWPEVNTVSVTRDGKIIGFDAARAATGEGPAGKNEDIALIRRTFTGVQVVDPAVLSLLPDRGRFAGIIDAYRALMARGETVAGYFFAGRWSDLGTAERYLQTAAERSAPLAFARAFDCDPPARIHWAPLAGDGSQRRWWRLSAAGRSLVAVSHGIRRDAGTEEVDAFVDIGRHLMARGVPVPKIYWHDRFSGLAFVEDLGDVHLAASVNAAGSDGRIDLYRRAIDAAVAMGLGAAEGFDPAWTWQSARYDRHLILEKECRYFSEAFVAGYLHRRDPFPSLAAEFSLLADRIAEYAVEGFIHRDFQSRNIMVHQGALRIIDFQGGRIGPVQYDIASLVVDPYVDLSKQTRAVLADYAADRLSTLTTAPRARCLAGIRYCALSRNLQILGAFGFLTARGKSWFERSIPAAVDGLDRALAELPGGEFPGLSALAKDLLEEMPKMPKMEKTDSVIPWPHGHT
jgi:aminoglycoside/choline kinase family phosphotransferase/dTDP-glucose pyrophosphorylase